MGLHDEAKLDRKFVEFAKLMNIHLNHFPKHEKYGLALEIRRAAYHAAARHKHGKRACFNFEKRLATNLDELFRELSDCTYKPRPYYSFMVYEPKPRRIFAPAFRDLVVQHAIYAEASPIFDCGFIEQSFACRTGYGTHKAADYAQSALQAVPRDSYTLKLDIRKFFYRINRDILRKQVERKIKDRRFIDVMMAFADHGEPVGIPIGNLLSQLYALIYLNPLDHFIKRGLGVRYYCRYVDDMVLFGLTRERAAECKAAIEAHIGTMGMELSKFSLTMATRGVNFVGYRTWASRRFIRRHSIFTYRRSVRHGNIESAVSILGHARNTHSLQHLLRIARRHHAIYSQLPKIYRQPDHPRASPADRLAKPSATRHRTGDHQRNYLYQLT